MKTYHGFGIKKEDRLVLLDLAVFDKFIKNLKDGAQLEVTVEEYREDGNDALRKYYFKCVATPIAAETGNSVETVHENMKLKYSSRVDKKGFIIIKSMFSKKADTTTQEKEEFTLKVRMFASDFLNMQIEKRGGGF
jgi:hypothetical protein